MENIKFESNDSKRKHFAKLHEKIQNKYEEMQKRLERSKSVDALLMLDDESDFKVTENKNNLNESSAVTISVTDSDKNEDFQILEFEDLNQYNDVFVKDIETEQATIVEDIDLPAEAETDKNYLNVNEHLNEKHSDGFYKTSLESLNEIGSDNSVPKTPTKISIRSRIAEYYSERRQKKKQLKLKNKKEPIEKVDKFILSSTAKPEKIESVKFKYKLATLTIALIEITGLEEMSEEMKPRHLCCRFRLGPEKYKSKVIKTIASTVKWQELINLNIYDEFILEVTLSDKELIIGRALINLEEQEKEKTYQMKIKLEDEAFGTDAEMLILLTISGTNLVNTVLDKIDYDETQKTIALNSKKYAWYSFRDDYRDVGSLSVIVHGAKELSGFDTYCILELNNERLQTHTEYKTNSPNWMKIFTFTVTDITSILNITVYDEKKSEILGRISIPLLRIKNGEKTWYSLKDNSLRERAKGNNARILLEMRVNWNLVKSSVRVINPKEVILLHSEEKLDRQIFARNISRSKAVISWILFAVQMTKLIFEWESRRTNTIALFTWILFCHFFKVWMLPLLLLIPFVWYRPDKYYLINWKRQLMNKYYNIEEEEDKSEKDEKNKSLRQKISSLQEMVQTVQNYIGTFASLGERIKNLFNFTEPYLSFLAIFLILAITLFMFLIPVKYILIGWGIHKFTRKIIRPNRIPNSEILDLLSRVPDDETLLDCEELPLDKVDEDE